MNVAEKTAEQKKEERERLVAAAEAGEAPDGVIDLDGEDDDEPANEAEPGGGVPSFVTLPAEWKAPDGWNIWFIKVIAKQSNLPRGPDLWCALWNLSEGDEKRAAKRARGEGLRIIDEMAKETIRAVGACATNGVPGDGYMADWSGNRSAPGSIDRFWTSIGGKYRHVIKSLYLKNHTFSVEEQANFFEHCVSVRRGG